MREQQTALGSDKPVNRRNLDDTNAPFAWIVRVIVNQFTGQKCLVFHRALLFPAGATTTAAKRNICCTPEQSVQARQDRKPRK
jgi:hypothetical protein